MNTQVKRSYEQKAFQKDQFKQFALKLCRFCNLTPSDFYVFLSRQSGDFETNTQYTIEDLPNIYEIGKSLDCLSFHSSSAIIRFSFKSHSNTLSVSYAVDGEIEKTKKIIFLAENTLELKELSEQEVRELIYARIQDNPDISDPKETKDVIDNDQPIDQVQMDSASSNPIATVWHKASKQLQLLCPTASYETWIAPIIPSINENQLLLTCPNEFVKEWIESRYLKDIIRIVQSIEPSVEEVIVRFSDKSANKRFPLEIDQQIFEVMKQVYVKETKNTVGWTFEKYFNQVIQAHCQERMDDSQDD